MPTITAIEMARKVGIVPDSFRAALRDANLDWHDPYERWTVEVGSDRHQDMQRILSELRRGA
jgi:hypothetical protein